MRTFRIVLGLPIALFGVMVTLVGVFIADGHKRAAEGLSEIGAFIEDVCRED